MTAIRASIIGLLLLAVLCGSVWAQSVARYAQTIGDAVNAGYLNFSDGSDHFATLTASGLAANYTLTLPTTDGAAGQVPESDGSGVLSWTTREKVIYSAITASAAHTGATAAATTVMPATSNGSVTIPVTYLGVGDEFEYDVSILFTGDADGDETLTANILFGSQAVGTSGALAVDAAGEIRLTGRVKIRTSSATGTGYYFGNSFSDAATATYGAAFSSFDCTAASSFIVQLDWGGTTDAADTATVHDARLTVVDW